jgi:Uma2 family endonuclease
MSTQTEETTPAAEVQSKKGTPTWEIAYLYPHQGQWTEAEYLALDTNRLIELSNGCLEFLPMPSMFHQDLVAFVYAQLLALVMRENLGRVYFAPLRVRAAHGTYREPDVVFLKHDRIRDRHVPPEGADLIVEVVSPGEEARKRDLQIKRDEYARAGISEYWIVDPEKQTVTVLVLEGEIYREHGEFKPGQSAESVLLPGFRLDVTALFAAGQTKEKDQ